MRFLNLLPLSHVFGQFLGMFLPPLLGGTVIFQDELKPSEIVETIRRERVSVLVSVPRVLQSLKQKVERDLEETDAMRRFQPKIRESEGQTFPSPLVDLSAPFIASLDGSFGRLFLGERRSILEAKNSGVAWGSR